MLPAIQFSEASAIDARRYANAGQELIAAVNRCLPLANEAVSVRSAAEKRPQHEISIRNFTDLLDQVEGRFKVQYRALDTAHTVAINAAAALRDSVGPLDPEIVLRIVVSDDAYLEIGTAAQILRIDLPATPEMFLKGIEQLNVAIEAGATTPGHASFLGSVYASSAVTEMSGGRIYFSALRDLFHGALVYAGHEVNLHLNDQEIYFAGISSPGIYALVQIVDVPQLGRILVDVHAGAAHSVTPSPEVLEVLATSSWRSDYGGVWARRHGEGTVMPAGSLSFGWRARWPSELVHASEPEVAVGFFAAMVSEFANVCRELHLEVQPVGGGSSMTGADQLSWPALVSGIVPPP